MHPVDLDWPDEPVIGAEAVHHVLKGWQADIAASAAAQSGESAIPVDSPGSSTRTSVSGE
jgi:hypothetical protein